MTLLRQIQEELASSNVDVAVVLRKCMILARRLRSKQFAQWVDWELNGYPEDAEVPAYRTVHPAHYASFTNGYQSVNNQPISTLLIDEKWRHIFEPSPYRAGIEVVKGLAAKGGGRLDRGDFRFLLTGKVIDLPCYLFWSHISEVELKQIISAVANRLLEFVMDIEEENPNAGEAPVSETPVAPERVQQLMHNHFYAPVGNIAQNSSGFNQTATMDFAQVRKLVTVIRDQLGAEQLDSAIRDTADVHLAKIDTELAAAAPDPSVVREAGRSLRTIIEGAMGNAIVDPDVWKVTLAMMTSLFG